MRCLLRLQDSVLCFIHANEECSTSTSMHCKMLKALYNGLKTVCDQKHAIVMEVLLEGSKWLSINSSDPRKDDWLLKGLQGLHFATDTSTTVPVSVLDGFWRAFTYSLVCSS